MTNCGVIEFIAKMQRLIEEKKNFLNVSGRHLKQTKRKQIWVTFFILISEWEGMEF